jgi:hypothetical protein
LPLAAGEVRLVVRRVRECQHIKLKKQPCVKQTTG